MRRGVLRIWQSVQSRGSVVAALILISMGWTSANAQTAVGGHVGFVIPWVTWTTSQTTTIADRFQIGFPVGVTFKGTGPLAIDLETIPMIAANPQTVSLTVDPGVLWGLSQGFTVGMRMAFSINSSQFGFIPLLHKAWNFQQPLGGIFKAYFVELDLPIQFNRPPHVAGSNSLTFATHVGLGF